MRGVRYVLPSDSPGQLLESMVPARIPDSEFVLWEGIVGGFGVDDKEEMRWKEAC